ncbi:MULTISPECIES: YceD family protein [Cohnella]|jgi:uncharacterized protein|uniref:YceD family protein n=1 Tax=Cohnella TaxID=329857 RepID=UPI000E38CD14|nr:DUF177 domain-containing protein [Cohnella sp.]REK67188.1 MAG: metal-binding protein [Cohnella sp.]
MLLNVQELAARGEPVRLSESFDATEAVKEVRDVKPLGPLSAELVAEYADGVIDVSGHLACKLQLACSRCLEPIEYDCQVSFQETFKIVPKEVAERGEQDDEDFVPIHGERLDLRPYVEEELLLHLPYALLCREDCKGLCPECGQNLNRGECGCNREKIDPRLMALKDWYDARPN